jgi:hypothetical protein
MYWIITLYSQNGEKVVSYKTTEEPALRASPGNGQYWELWAPLEIVFPSGQEGRNTPRKVQVTGFSVVVSMYKDEI